METGGVNVQSERSRWFQHKKEEVRDEIQQWTNGTHQDFIKQCQSIDNEKANKMSLVEQYRDLQIQNINNQFQATKKQLEDEADKEKSEIRHNMINALIDKQHRLDEEQNDDGSTTYEAVSTRKLRRRNTARYFEDSVTQPLTLFNYKKRLPALNFTLRDDEIIEDLGIITKASHSYNRASLGLRDKQSRTVKYL
eukprot:gb/GECH01014920.1/.p1 GENE.gb/GECH01014920.1/~~gb/GECH01014920.1/.p1  ORF type:complete len:195 (+),score=37.18 gb/GECH01014920.1/:1-585(+)